MARSTLSGRLGLALAAAASIPAGAAAFSAVTARRVARAVPQAGRILEIGGERLHVSDSGGSGPAILLLHGLSGNMLNLLPRLAPHLVPCFRLVAIDRPDSGYSVGARGRPGNIRAQGWVRDVIEALGLDRPLVVGHSLGGAIALAAALDHPEQVGGLALLTPLTQVETVPPRLFRFMAIRNALLRRCVAWTLAVPFGIRYGGAAMAQVFAPEPVPDDFDTVGGGLLGLRPSAFMAASRDLVASGEDLPGLVRRYNGLRLPIGILFGAEDRVLAAWKHGALMQASVPGLLYEEIAGAGHMLPFTRPEQTAAFIRRMADRVAAGRTGGAAATDRARTGAEDALRVAPDADPGRPAVAAAPDMPGAEPAAAAADRIPAQTGPTQAGLIPTGAIPTGATPTGSTLTGPTQTGPAATGATQAGPTQTGSTPTGPTPTGPTLTRPAATGATEAGPTQTGSTPTGPTLTGPTQAGPTLTGPVATERPATGAGIASDAAGPAQGEAGPVAERAAG